MSSPRALALHLWLGKSRSRASFCGFRGYGQRIWGPGSYLEIECREVIGQTHLLPPRDLQSTKKNHSQHHKLVKHAFCPHATLKKHTRARATNRRAHATTQRMCMRRKRIHAGIYLWAYLVNSATNDGATLGEVLSVHRFL